MNDHLNCTYSTDKTCNHCWKSISWTSLFGQYAGWWMVSLQVDLSRSLPKFTDDS